MKYLIAFVCLLVAALLVYNWKSLDSGGVSQQLEKIQALEKIVQATELQKSPTQKEIRLLREVFFEVNLEKASQESVQSLRVIKRALGSKNFEVKSEALAQTKSLLIQFAHHKLAINENLQTDLESLFRTFKREGADFIAEIASANPASPTLTYLSQL